MVRTPATIPLPALFESTERWMAPCSPNSVRLEPDTPNPPAPTATHHTGSAESLRELTPSMIAAPANRATSGLGPQSPPSSCGQSTRAEGIPSAYDVLNVAPNRDERRTPRSK